MYVCFYDDRVLLISYSIVYTVNEGTRIIIEYIDPY